MMFILYIVALIVFLFLWDYSYDKIHKMRAMKLKEKYLEFEERLQIENELPPVIDEWATIATFTMADYAVFHNWEHILAFIDSTVGNSTLNEIKVHILKSAYYNLRSLLKPEDYIFVSIKSFIYRFKKIDVAISFAEIIYYTYKKEKKINNIDLPIPTFCYSINDINELKKREMRR